MARDYDYYNHTSGKVVTFNDEEKELTTHSKDNMNIGRGFIKFSDSRYVNDHFIVDKAFSEFTQKIDNETGFLHLKGIVARTGIQDYLGIELGIDGLEPMQVYKVYRPQSEVLHEESLKTYINATVTDEHPSEFVNTENINQLGKGSSANYEILSKDGIYFIKSELVITDRQLIDKVLNGKVEISAGYTQKLIYERGEFMGQTYDFKQTNIRINHIAIVDRGRCGSDCKLTIDNNTIIKDEIKHNERKMMASITIDGVAHEITDCVAKHIGFLNSKISLLDEEMKAKEEEMEKKDEELEKVKAEKDMTEEELKKEKEKTGDSAIAQIVDAKVDMMAKAKSMGVACKSSDSILDMKKAMLTAKTTVSLDGKSEAYIDAAFDMLLDSEIKKSQEKTVDGFESKNKDNKFENLKSEVY